MLGAGYLLLVVPRTADFRVKLLNCQFVFKQVMAFVCLSPETRCWATQASDHHHHHHHRTFMMRLLQKGHRCITEWWRRELIALAVQAALTCSLLLARMRVRSGRRICGQTWTCSSCKKASRAIWRHCASCRARSRTSTSAKFSTKGWKSFETHCRCSSTLNMKHWEIGKSYLHHPFFTHCKKLRCWACPILHCVSKNVPSLTGYNFNTHPQIF